MYYVTDVFTEPLIDIALAFCHFERRRWRKWGFFEAAPQHAMIEIMNL